MGSCQGGCERYVGSTRQGISVPVARPFIPAAYSPELCGSIGLARGHDMISDQRYVEKWFCPLDYARIAPIVDVTGWTWGVHSTV